MSQGRGCRCLKQVIVLVGCLVVSFVPGALAQVRQPAAPRPVQWRSGAWQPAPSAKGTEHALRAFAEQRPAGHMVVQFRAPVTPAQRASLAASGLHLVGYLGSDTYFVRVEGGRVAKARLTGLAPIAAVTGVNPVWKVETPLAREDVPEYAYVGATAAGSPIVAVYVLLHRDVPLWPTADTLAQAHGGVVRSTLRSINGLVLELPLHEVAGLAAHDAVAWIESPIQFDTCNDSNRLLTEAETVQSPPYGLDGSGVRVLVYDGATVYASHPDLIGRVTVPDAMAVSEHPTHVAGTVGGSGAASGGQYRGMAPAVGMVSYGYMWDYTGIFFYANPGDIEHDYDEAINVYAVDLATNSIGMNVCRNGLSCEYTGKYGMTSALVDAIVGGSLGRPLPVLWANGNERSCDRCREEGVHTPAGYHSTAPPACAKNHITVGAVNSNDDSVTYFTSFGPCDDGRIKPDICAPGCQTDGDQGVTSASDSGGYSTHCGTSMATPTAAGLTALLMQDFRAQFPGRTDPRGATVKVLLAHNATDIAQPGPDYQSGYGSVRIQRTIDFMRTGRFSEQSVDHGSAMHYFVDVTAGAEPLVLTLAWDDAPAIPNVVPSLVNDLDLVVRDPNGVQHFPWTLDPNVPIAAAVRVMADHINNIEQVQVDNPVAGRWQVEVYGYNVPEGPQAFSLAGSPMLILDCDDDDMSDAQEIAADPGLDCTGNGLLDVCEPDCNANSRADSCDIADGTSDDCNANGTPDECEPDCNANGIADECDIRDGTSTDCDANGVPDDCQDTNADCNENGIWDACDIANGTSTDINENGIPDDCESAAGVLYVADCEEGGAGTLDDPFCRIKYAISLALPGATIIVRDGYYDGFANRNLNFGGRDFVLMSENGSRDCIIDCGGVGRGFIFESGETSAARVQGFSIYAGYDFLKGGCILCQNASPTFVDCYVCGGESARSGGGISVMLGARPTFIDCTIESCTATSGGGVNIMSDGCTFDRCAFNWNFAIGGAGVTGYFCEQLVLRNCLFRENVCSNASSYDPGHGGGVHLSHAAATIENCTFVGNYVRDVGAVLEVTEGSTALLRNTLCWDNVSGAGPDIVMESNENTYLDDFLTVDNCNIEGGVATVDVCAQYCFLNWGDDNIEADPLFWEDPSDGLHVRPDSPCVNAGDLYYVPTADERDFDGEPRIQGGRIDIGADEVVADCNNNGMADYRDIADGTSADDNGNGIPDECEPQGDLDGDNDVDWADFLLFAQCLAGPGNPNPGIDPALFTQADLSSDGDVDLQDFRRLQAACGNKRIAPR